MSKLAIDLDSDNKIAAIVPRLTDAGRPLSPASIGVWGEKQFSADFVGIARGETRALNSASMLRVNALRKIGGYDPYFWLDYVDISMYRRLYLYGWKVYVAGDIHVKHELSLLHRADIKTDRFQNILRAESAFCDLYDGRIRGFVLTGRLLGRMWRQKKRGDSVAIRQLTWNALKRRLLQSRTRRIQDWKSETGHRMSCSLGAAQCGELSTNRSPISVCMAAYNGERYIVAQLQSILSQLAVEDEVIVVDDASTDGTRDRVRSLRDCRIQLIEHSRNLGVSRTFEDAIRKVKNSTIFLSDQDDLWVADKVSTVLHAFRQHPEANIVVSDAALIDDKDAPVEPSYYARRGRFRSGVLANVFRCSYLGCTMAFRSSILPKILPFPTGADVLHDVWIGTLNSLTDGKTLYVDRPLVLYRRHECNATGNKRLSMARQIRIRWDLCRSLAIFWLDSHRANDK
jgi:GT2 family glycosyltransferase